LNIIAALKPVGAIAGQMLEKYDLPSIDLSASYEDIEHDF